MSTEQATEIALAFNLVIWMYRTSHFTLPTLDNELDEELELEEENFDGELDNYDGDSRISSLPTWLTEQCEN